jgi:hypothetical protein
MPTTDLEAARRHHRALKHFFVSHTGEAPDLRALRRVLTLCESASAAVDDDYCREKLRQQVLNGLELLASRLYSLGALRRTAERKGMPKWTTRSSIAQI